MKFSIITPHYNSKNEIVNCFKSVHDTFYGFEYEHIVIDDNSSQDDFNFLSAFAEDNLRNIKLYRNKKNYGPGYSRNIGLDSATGDYIIFIDADDVFADSFRIVINRLVLSKKYNLFICGGYFINDVTISKFTNIFIPNKNINKQMILTQCPFSCLSSIISRNYLITERFPEIEREDLPLWYNLFGLVPVNNFVFLQFPIGIYNISPKQRTFNKTKLISVQYLLYRNYFKFSIIYCVFLMILWFIKGVKKYKIQKFFFKFNVHKSKLRYKLFLEKFKF